MNTIFHFEQRFDWKLVVITVVSTLLILLDTYHQFTPSKAADRTIFFLLIPLIIILFIFRENPANYGFQLGNWRAGLAITSASLVLLLPVLWFVMKNSQRMSGYYQPYFNPGFPFYTFFDLIGWEFLFRGWLTFAYVRKFGPEGLWLQAVPFAIAHINKPEIETLSTIFGGFVFGWIAWRTQSFIYPFLIHWAIFTFVILVTGGTFG